MTAPTKTPRRPPGSLLVVGRLIPPWQTPPWTMEERLERIEALAKRIQGYAQFMGAVGDLHGTSAEAKEKAVAAFYERMVVLERELSVIHEELRLG